MNLLRVDGWGDVFFLLVATLSAIGFWYMHDFYVSWIVAVVGIGAGIVLYLITQFEEDHPVASFPITMVFIIVMFFALHEETLVAGVVAAFTTTTAIKVYEVYL